MAIYEITSNNANDYDEVTQYQMGRYISSNEAVWRILDFNIHKRHPAVMHLGVHLENGQRVYFTTENATERAQNPPQTTLTAFFKLCTEDEFACTLLYHQVPRYYTWNKDNKKWKRRSNGQNVPGFPGIKSTDSLGRVYTVHPNNSECFHLRLLLHEVRGPTSFKYLRTVDNRLCETYKEACHLIGLLENDENWNKTLEEAAATRSPKMLRNLFAVMLLSCNMSNPLQLWENHKENLSEDILHQVQLQQNNTDISYNQTIFNKTLIMIENKIQSLGGKYLQTYGLPEPSREQESSLNNELLAELSYDADKLKKYLEENEPKLVQDQKEAYDKVMDAVSNIHGGIYFLDAPGGIGKTFLINLLLAKVRLRKEIALAVASSGIAATLLTGGRTAHSALKLPLNLASTETPTCNISSGSNKAIVLQKCKLIIWDECTMLHKSALEALDVSLRDIRHNSHIMGGIILVLAGDFRQTLPVIPRGTRADEMKACIKSSYLWNSIIRLRLTTNMRVHINKDSSEEDFADKLLQLGNGAMVSDEHGFISAKDIGRCVLSLDELKQAVFPDLIQQYRNPQWLSERAILAPKNDAVNSTNKELLKELPGTIHVYKSFDTTCDAEQVLNYPTEFLNSLELPGIPSHILELKIGAPIVLLRNLDPPSLCNGTRLIIKNLKQNVIEATIMSGHAAGEDVFIMRMPMVPTEVPFEFRRVQFPIRLSFAMSINKAQGQSLKVVGLDLRNPCFSHGQLYVGCSRVGNSQHLYILAPKGKTINIVYPEALDG